ncbi:MAG: GntR family transcriptional regulator [Acidimicrobiales bacterium]
MAPQDGDGAVLAGLRRDRDALLGRTSTAEHVAQVLRSRIMEGLFPPGSRLPEETIAAGLGVSRNTVREAFRFLCHEWLAVHELNRGVFVAVPTHEDVVDLYRVRRIVETAAAKAVGTAPRSSLRAVKAAVESGRRAARASRWEDVGTADLAFHQAIAGLAASPRVDELMRRVLAELRLVFHVMADPERFHAPYLKRNGEIAALLGQGDGAAAVRELRVYLDDAEEQLLGAYAEARRRAGSRPEAMAGGRV